MFLKLIPFAHRDPLRDNVWYLTKIPSFIHTPSFEMLAFQLLSSIAVLTRFTVCQDFAAHGIGRFEKTMKAPPYQADFL